MVLSLEVFDFERNQFKPPCKDFFSFSALHSLQHFLTANENERYIFTPLSTAIPVGLPGRGQQRNFTSTGGAVQGNFGRVFYIFSSTLRNRYSSYEFKKFNRTAVVVQRRRKLPSRGYFGTKLKDAWPSRKHKTLMRLQV